MPTILRSKLAYVRRVPVPMKSAKFLLACATVFAATLYPAAGWAQQSGGAQSLPNDLDIQMLPGDESRARLYEHPIRKYSIAVPAGTQMGERGTKKDLFVQSRRGFVVTIQTGDANRSLDLGMMAARMESQYLGIGKAWERKLGDREIEVAALPAYDGVYEGANTRTRVVITRGAMTDFVFVFRAAPENFADLERDFNWMLENFRPAATERSAQPIAPKGELSSAQPDANAASTLDSAALPSVAPPADGGLVFADAEVGYAIRHPGDWIVAKPSAFTTMFSGSQGSTAYFTTISVQNVKPPSAIDPADAVTRVFENLRSQLYRGAKDLTFLAEGTYIHDQGGVALIGRQFVVSYARENRLYRQWTVISPRDTGTIAHVWSYAAPDEQFDSFRPVAEWMLGSWRIGPQIDGAPLQ